MKKFLSLLLSTALFAETVISPNMNLPVPVVGTTPGPQWANDINSCMSTIDQHDHTPGNGVQISSSALNINTDLPLGGNSLTQAKSVGFTSQASFSTSRSLYVISPDLYYNDGDGNVIQITQSGSVAGASGTITGLPSGTASASYQSVGGTFRFQSATNTPANGSFASLTIAQQTATPNTITLKSPTSLAASYNVTFPTSVPSYTSLLTMSTSGVLSTVPYAVPTVQKFTSGSGTYTTPTNPTPVYIKVVVVGGGGGGSGSSTAAGNDGGNGGNGGDSTFGTALLTAAGGSGGTFGNNSGAAGGAATVSAPAFGTGLSGGRGGGQLISSGSNMGIVTGGYGGNGAFGGAGAGAPGGAGAGATNTGSGGAGATVNTNSGSSCHSGTGGGAGAYIEAFITGPSASYGYAVGAAGTAGTAGTGGNSGGAGGSGYIEVTEYYQ